MFKCLFKSAELHKQGEFSGFDVRKATQFFIQYHKYFIRYNKMYIEQHTLYKAVNFKLRPTCLFILVKIVTYPSLPG